MKDWCHTNNILQVHCWGCLVVQVMFHALMTSLMTSQGHKVGQFLNWYISVKIWATVSIKSSKCRKCYWLSFWYIQLPVSLPVKKIVASSKWRPFYFFLDIKHSFNLNSDLKRSSQIMQKNISHYNDVIDDVTGWPQSFSLYSCLGNVGTGSKLQGQCLVNKCQYHNCLSMLYMPKNDLNE